MEPTTSTSKPLKRKIEPTENETEVNKKLKAIHEYQTGITDLPDCLLTVLFSYLDATSLYCISQTCYRFNVISRDPRYWLHVEGRRRPSLSGKVAYCEGNVHERATHVMLAHDDILCEAVSEDFFGNLRKFDWLKVLALENQKINGHKYPLRSFPPTLQELSLRKTIVVDSFFFFRFSKNLTQLRVLLLDYCDWVQSSALISLANFNNLEILSLYMCRHVSDERCVGYLGIASHGFKNLKIVDARFSGLGSRLISALYHSPTLQEIYFQGYTTTFHLERLRRKLAVMNGAKRDEFALSSDEEDYVEWKQSDEGESGTSKRRHRQRYVDDIDDLGLVMLRHLRPAKQQQPKPISYLFKDVYGDCRCGFLAASKEKAETNSRRRKQMRPEDNQHSTDDEDDVKDAKQLLVGQIIRRRRRLARMLRLRRVPFEELKFRKGIPHPDRLIENGQQCVIVVDLSRNGTENNEVHCEHFHGFHNRPLPSSPSPPASPAFPDSDSESDRNSDSEASSSSSLTDDGEDDGADLLRRQRTFVFRLNCINSQREQIGSNLRKLSLRGYPNVTHHMLRNLYGLGLELLDVRYTNVKGKALRRFMERNPECRVVHRTACVCAPRLHF